MYTPKSRNSPVLTEIAKSQPHTALAALTHGMLSRWTYLSCVYPDIVDELSPLDNVLRSKLLRALTLTGRPPPSDLKFALFAHPARLGGLGQEFRQFTKLANGIISACHFLP